MFKPDGYALTYWPDDPKRNRQQDTYQCNHCGAHKHLNVGEVPYATCKLCMGFLCAHCYGRLAKDGCRTQEKWLEQMERAITNRLHRERDFRRML